MRQSQLFTKTRREAPADEVSKNAILLTRAGFIHKEMAGVYSYLPLGLRVLKKIENIIREEMNTVGGQEILMTTLQDPEIWKKTNRWSDDVVDNWFKTKLANGSELGLGFTHEEPVVRIASNNINSYKDLPISIYQIQTKFRNELRSKSGIMRGREFLMKDMYTFAKSKEEQDQLYAQVRQAYINIFSRTGIGEKTFITFASGGVFSKFSEEFQTESDSGEDVIYFDPESSLSVNREVFTDEVLKDLKLDKSKMIEKKSIEVGNIFYLGTRFSEPLGLIYQDEDGSKKSVVMGTYGIGLGRLMGVVAEVLSDEKGIVWPKEVAPFRVHLISLGETKELADEVYNTLVSEGVEVLYDDRDLRAGEKFADADLIGIPTRVVIGEKSLESQMLEVKERNSDDTRMLTLTHLLDELKS